MNRFVHLRSTLSCLLLAVVLVGVGTPAAHAQCRLRDPSLTNHNGEPTDPEEALAVLTASGVDTDFDRTVPEGESEADSWFEALLHLLQQLGLLEGPDEGAGP